MFLRKDELRMVARTITAKDIENKMVKVLLTLDSDPKMQELLAIYQKLPEREQDTLLLMLDAFSAGMKVQKSIDSKEPVMA